MGEAHKLTEAQARIAADMASGTVIWRSRWSNSYCQSPGNGMVVTVSRPVIDRMRDRGLIALTSKKTNTGNSMLVLTDAGRAALARHRGETP